MSIVGTNHRDPISTPTSHFFAPFQLEIQPLSILHYIPILLCILLYKFLAVQTYGTKDFVMAVAFPNLNYSLLAELTTNIEDFVCMELQGVTVQNKGANVNYNGTATPKYYSTNNDGKNDRVVIDFGFLRVCFFFSDNIRIFCNDSIANMSLYRIKYPNVQKPN